MVIAGAIGQSGIASSTSNGFKQTVDSPGPNSSGNAVNNNLFQKQKSIFSLRSTGTHGAPG
jgi:hypothetical protein